MTRGTRRCGRAASWVKERREERPKGGEEILAEVLAMGTSRGPREWRRRFEHLPHPTPNLLLSLPPFASLTVSTARLRRRASLLLAQAVLLAAISEASAPEVHNLTELTRLQDLRIPYRRRRRGVRVRLRRGPHQRLWRQRQARSYNVAEMDALREAKRELEEKLAAVPRSSASRTSSWPPMSPTARPTAQASGCSQPPLVAD